ncbi:MAG: lysophospholipid acyltransferase family protein [Balneolaceae bacterium]
MRKNYLWYQMFRYPIVGAALRVFYKKVKVSGKEHLPKNKPILFVPNHQNSFMDALLVVCSVRPFIYFLTRAEAFNPPLLGWFLGTLNMLPVYRVRDGFSSVQKNNAIFELCFSYFKRNDAVLIFPEANHDLKKRIRPLSKGFTRIAFGAEVKNDWELDLQIVPVGLNYTEQPAARTIVHVNYGKPIPVKDFEAAFKEDENEATKQMKEVVSGKMKELVFHVPNLEEYPVQKILWHDLESNQHHLTNPDIVNNRIHKTKPHITQDLIKETKELDKMITGHDVTTREIASPSKFSFKDALLLPFLLFSFLNNIIPYQPIKYLTTKVIKDHAFDASIKFLTGLFLLPIFYLIVCVILGLFGIEWKYLLGYFGLSFVTAPLFIRAKELFTSDPVRRLKKQKPDIFNEIQSRLDPFRKLRDSILNE